MRRLVTVGILVLATPMLAFAHVSVRPRESNPTRRNGTPSGSRQKELSRQRTCYWRYPLA
jgi:hypothetical protein